MATLQELEELKNNSLLKAKVWSAVLKAAEAIRVEDPATSNHTNRLIWAKQALVNPEAKRDEMYPALLAANADAAVGSITGATDADIETAVNAAVDVFADGS